MKKIIVVASVALIAACSSGPQDYTSHQRVTVVDSSKNHLADQTVVQSQLKHQFNVWRGVPYRNGGLSRKGVDCSGFVYLTYLEQFGLSIPRTTQYQSMVGTSVSRSQLRAGDLVFFKTGFKARHVGIYLNNARFIHASTSKGVVISSLNTDYWMDKYWQARRIQN